MKNEIKKVPDIRFKGFIDDWEQCKLGEIVNKAVDNRGKTPPISDEGTHPLIEVACLGNGFPDYSKIKKYLDDITFKSMLREYIKKDDILFSTVGSIGLVSLMDSHENAAIAQNIVAFRAKENYDSHFLYAMFSTKGNQNKAMRIVMGAVQPSIKVSQLINVEYYITHNIKEEELLGSFFLHIDHLITLHQRKLKQLQTLKKYFLQNMFPAKEEKVPEIRFKGFTDDWEQRKFGYVFTEYSDKGHEQFPALTIIQGHGTITRDESDRNMIYDKNGLRNYKLVNKSDFIVHLRSFEGGFEIANSQGIVSPAYHVFHGEDANSRFYYPYFRSFNFINAKLKPFVYGIRDGRSIDIQGMKKALIPYPSYEEQTKIGNLLTKIDSIITLHQRKCDQLQSFKKFMLQNLFI